MLKNRLEIASNLFFYPKISNTIIGTAIPKSAIFQPFRLKLFFPLGNNIPVTAITINEIAKISEYTTQNELVNLCKNLVCPIIGVFCRYSISPVPKNKSKSTMVLS